MNSTMNFSLIMSEIVLLAAICVILIVDLFQRDKERNLTYALTQLTLIGLFVLGYNDLAHERAIIFNGHWVIDKLSIVLKLSIYFVAFISILYARPFMSHRKMMRGEYYLLTLFSVLGMMIMVSANSFLMVYLGLELLSLSLYALVALQRDSKLVSEAAVKFFIMGGLASGFLLYGISLVYGIAGSIVITDVAQHYSKSGIDLISQFGLVFIVIGVAFKFGAVPFHMWLPDIYHGSPGPVTAYVASAPKIAAFGMAMRLLIEAFALFSESWTHMILVIALLSIAFGNIVAVSQSNLKRLLAYSAIAHIGYFLLGLVPGTQASYSASMYYIIVYAFMTLAGFGIVIFLSTEKKEYQAIADLRGLGRYYPWYAFMFTVVMVSLAGIPPFVGFWPKLEIFRHLISGGLVYEALIAILFSVIGVYYYLKVIKEMFFEAAVERPNISTSRSLKIAISVNCLLLIIFGLMPDSVYRYCLDAFGLLLI